ncbi:heavy-metal-associated domain-containing protein [Bacteroidota bacterium]
MKKTILSTMILVMIAVAASFGQAVKTEKFKVYGNCSMCESRIEKAGKSVEGVSVTDWDKETKMIAVSFDSEKTDVHKIHMAIAKVGHDTDMHKAEKSVYDELPGCCQYDRKEN